MLLLLIVNLVCNTTVMPARTAVATARDALRSAASSAARFTDTLPQIPFTPPPQPTASAPLVFDGVIVIDVEHGRRIANQRVVIVGNRIRKMGKLGSVSAPSGARVVDARGKYLIPGLWDMHTHSFHLNNFFYPLFLVNGVTGIRDAWSDVPLDTLIMWRREILAGKRVGPPRQLFAGPKLDQCLDDFGKPVNGKRYSGDQCLANSTDVRRVVDSLKAAGADMIKLYGVKKAMYFTIAAEARRIGVPFGGHVDDKEGAINVSDSGASIVDHLEFRRGLDLVQLCWASEVTASLAQCKRISDHLKRNNTWFAPTLSVFYQALPVWLEMSDGKTAVKNVTEPATEAVFARFRTMTETYWNDSLPHGNWLRDTASSGVTAHQSLDSSKMRFLIRSGMPMLAGTDIHGGSVFDGNLPRQKMLPGFSLLTELAMYSADGMPPLEVLQTATLNPAKLLRATDSMGTVARGKLADLVLLDADPLSDITNLTMIRAVVANGRYFDRDALDKLLKWVQSQNKKWQ